MSVTNGERLVTKQDLADMYQGILPYLGGMPEVLANKFSKGDMYSTDEKMIGQWIDGKPLYQKVVTGIGITVGSKTVITDSTLELKNSYGYFITDNTTTRMIPYHDKDNWHVFPACANGVISLTISGWNKPTAPWQLVLQYTKTTDTTISIGSDTDYSTEEKIVGTWIDGKPIYQRTWTGTTGTSTSSDLFTITGADKIIRSEGYVDDGNGYFFNLNYCQGTDNFYSIFTKDGVVKFRKQAGNNYSYAITVQYTKTT